MFNSTFVSTLFNARLAQYNQLKTTRDAAESRWNATPFGDPQFAALFKEYHAAEIVAVAYWNNQLAPVMDAIEAGWKTVVGVIDGSELLYREMKENMVSALDAVLKYRDLELAELAWAARWMRAAIRFPSIVGHLLPAIKFAYDIFTIAAAIKALQAHKGYYNDLMYIWEREGNPDDAQDGLHMMESELRSLLHKTGVSKEALEFLRAFDIREVINL